MTRGIDDESRLEHDEALRPEELEAARKKIKILADALRRQIKWQYKSMIPQESRLTNGILERVGDALSDARDELMLTGPDKITAADRWDQEEPRHEVLASVRGFREVEGLYFAYGVRRGSALTTGGISYETNVSGVHVIERMEGKERVGKIVVATRAYMANLQIDPA